MARFDLSDIEWTIIRNRRQRETLGREPAGAPQPAEAMQLNEQNRGLGP